MAIRHSLETFEERPILAKYKEGDGKDLGFWFIVKCLSASGGVPG